MTLVIEISCTGSNKAKRMVLKNGESLEIGRSNSDASLVVDARLSRKHFAIRFIDGQIEVTHISQTNPTMVAPQGSSDFAKIKGIHCEPDGCRIIAGSHRFVLTVAKPESVALMGFSDDLSTDEGAVEHRSEFWSDVDSGTSEPMIDVFDQTDSGEKGSRSRNPPETVPVTRQEVVSQKLPEQQPTQHNTLFDDEEVPRQKHTTHQGSKPRKKSETKKPFFPIADDFFED